MPDKINIKKVTGYDSYNNATFTIELTQGKIEYQFKKVTNAQGEEVTSSGTFRTESNIKITDMIEIDGDYRPFIQVQPQTDFSGVTQYTIGWF